jgi:hypothetical protein
MEVTDIGVSTHATGAVPLPAIAFAFRDGGGVRAQATPSDEQDRAHVVAMLRELAPAEVTFHERRLGRGSIAGR